MPIFAILCMVLCAFCVAMKEWNGFNFFLFLTFFSGMGYVFQLLR